MAIALDVASSNAASLGAATTHTFAHTCTGTELILVVLTGCSNSTDGNRNITGITYNAIPLVQVREDNNNTSDLTTEIWYLVGPATGANNVVVTYAGTGNAVVNGALSFTGVSQITPIDTHRGTTGNSQDATIGISTTFKNEYQVAIGFEAGNRAITVAGGQTSAWSAGINPLAAAGYQAVVSPGLVNPSFTWTVAADDWGCSAVTIRESYRGASFSPNKLRPAIFSPGNAR
jgi:hypothetical protein